MIGGGLEKIDEDDNELFNDVKEKIQRIRDSMVRAGEDLPQVVTGQTEVDPVRDMALK